MKKRHDERSKDGGLMKTFPPNTGKPPDVCRQTIERTAEKEKHEVQYLAKHAAYHSERQCIHRLTVTMLFHWNLLASSMKAFLNEKYS